MVNSHSIDLIERGGGNGPVKPRQPGAAALVPSPPAVYADRLKDEDVCQTAHVSHLERRFFIQLRGEGASKQ
jgi:hypothetical protein